MSPENSLKSALKKPAVGNSRKTSTIQITFLADKQELAESDLSIPEILEILASQAEVGNFTGARITFDDGRKSYTFTLDMDELVLKNIEIENTEK